MSVKEDGVPHREDVKGRDETKDRAKISATEHERHAVNRLEHVVHTQRLPQFSSCHTESPTAKTLARCDPMRIATWTLVLAASTTPVRSTRKDDVGDECDAWHKAHTLSPVLARVLDCPPLRIQVSASVRLLEDATDESGNGARRWSEWYDVDAALQERNAERRDRRRHHAGLRLIQNLDERKACMGVGARGRRR
jgi:hypothetical protein